MLDSPIQDQPPPHEGRFLVVDQEAHRDDLHDAVADKDFDGRDLADLRGAPEATFDAQHSGHRKAPDVGVHDPDGHAASGQRCGQVDSHRRLADATLTGGHHQYSGGSRDLGVRRIAAYVEAGSGHSRGLFLGGEFVPRQVDRRHAGQVGYPGPDVTLDLGAKRATRGSQGNRHVDPAVVVDGHGAGHAQFDDVGAQFGVDDPAEHPHHVVGGRAGSRDVVGNRGSGWRLGHGSMLRATSLEPIGNWSVASNQR